ncbi:FAD:protein FMN transferase, partial [Nostoc sp. NIES-2111]
FASDGPGPPIIDPHSATCPPAGRAASVIAPNATDADALATALTLLPPSTAPRLMQHALGARALLSEPGQAQRWLA